MLKSDKKKKSFCNFDQSSSCNVSCATRNPDAESKAKKKQFYHPKQNEKKATPDGKIAKTGEHSCGLFFNQDRWTALFARVKSPALRPDNLCWIFRRSSKTRPKVDLLKGRGFLVLFPRSVCIFRNQKVRPFNFTRFSRGFNFKDLVYINFLWKKFQIRKSKSLKMDSEAILGPKWKPRGVLESGEHVESDFDLPRT